MTVAAQTPISSYTGNGVTTAFSFGYYVAASGDLVVMVDGVVKALTTDYTLTGIGSGSGGTCTFVTAPASGAAVVLYRDTDLLRDTDYQDNGDLLAAILNGDFDRVWLALQETITGAKLSPRAVRAPVGETLNELPEATTRAGKILSFNASTGQPEAVAPTSGTATDLAIQLASTATGQGSALVGVQGGGTVYDYTAGLWLSPAADGAIGDGITNDTAAIQATIAKANIGGNKTVVFAGQYHLGTYSGAMQSLFDITADGVTLVFLSGTKFQVRADASLVEIFRVNGASRVTTIGELFVETESTTTYTTDGTAGARAFVINNSASGDNVAINIDSIRLKRGAVGLLCYGTNSATNRTKGIKAKSVLTEDATYGVNCASNGDDVRVTSLTTYNAYRSWFAYNCARHYGHIKAHDHKTGGTCINLTRFSTVQGGANFNTEDMNLDVDVTDPQSNVTVLTLRFIGDEGGSAQLLRGVNVRVSANKDVSGLTPVSILNFLTSGGSVTATAFASVMSGVSIDCNMPASGTSNFITFSGSNWSAKPAVYWRGSFVVTPDAQLVAQSSITLRVTEASTWVSFTPTITGSSTAGVGTYTTQTGRYTRIGNTVHFTLRLAWTAHTGTGNMRVSGMPYAVSASVDHFTYPVWAQNIALTASNLLCALHTTGTTNITLQQYAVGGGAIANVTLDTAGEIIVSGTYAID